LQFGGSRGHRRQRHTLEAEADSGSKIPPTVLVGGTIFSTSTLSKRGINLFAIFPTLSLPIELLSQLLLSSLTYSVQLLLVYLSTDLSVSAVVSAQILMDLSVSPCSRSSSCSSSRLLVCFSLGSLHCRAFNKSLLYYLCSNLMVHQFSFK
jgi:hypothetical protein